MAGFAVLAALSFFTLTGAVRGATLLMLGGLAAKTWIALLRTRQDNAGRTDAAGGGQEDDRARGSN